MKPILYQRGKIWYVILRLDNGKNKWVSTRCTLKSEAQCKIGEIVDRFSYLEETGLDSPDLPFCEYLMQWKLKQKDRVAETTYETYYSYFDKHMKPYFEQTHLKTREVTPKAVNSFIDHLLSTGRLHEQGGLSPTTVRKILSLLKNVLNSAVIDGYLEHNPAAVVVVRRHTKSGKTQIKHAITSFEEAQTVLNAFRETYLFPIVNLAMYYGFRRSELLGLRWSAIDFEKKTIAINHVVVRTNKAVPKDEPKNASSGKPMPLMEHIEKLLLELKKTEEKNRAFFGSEYIENDYVFKRENGITIAPDRISKDFKKIIKRHNLPIMRFHDLRHSTASLLKVLGVDIYDSKEWMRHSDISTTANIYTHSNEQKMRQLGKMLSDELL